MNHRQLIAATLIAVASGASFRAAAEDLDRAIAEQARSAQGEIRGEMRRNLRHAMRPLLPEVPYVAATAEKVAQPVAAPVKVSCPIAKPEGATYNC